MGTPWIQYMIYKSNRNTDANIFLEKTIIKKELLTFGWPKIGHTFISPYHTHFSMDFKILKNMYVNEKSKISSFHT